MTIPYIDKFKTAEGKFSTWVKVVGLVFTAATIVFGAGKIAATVSVTDKRVTEVRQEVQDVRADVKSVDLRVRSVEIHDAKHDVIDSLVLSSVRESNALMKEIKSERKIR